ncbi:MAG: hypothetical protein KZQ73_03930 [Candidatus Thiodiazotropha sp. (ex Semelilucina semeliformis)]|nr:hypothetical protein [Candidatus Thiodiazotropha sp. (ex Semelilucina semeliformis)]
MTPNDPPHGIQFENDYGLIGRRFTEDDRHKLEVSETFFLKASDPPLDINMDMVRAISQSSYALDMYALLCYASTRVRPRVKYELSKIALYELNGHMVSRKSKYSQNVTKAFRKISLAQQSIIKKLKKQGQWQGKEKLHNLLAIKVDLSDSKIITFSHSPQLEIIEKSN